MTQYLTEKLKFQNSGVVLAKTSFVHFLSY